MAGSGGRGLNNAKEDFYGSGGNDFSWTDTAHDAIADLGRLTRSIVINGVGALFGDIQDAFDSNGKQQIQRYIGQASYVEVEGTNYDNWPSNAPAKVYVSKGNSSFTHWMEGTSNYYYLTSYSEDVYMIGNFSNAVPRGSAYTVRAFSKTPFSYNTAGFSRLESVAYPSPNINATEKTSPQTYYMIGTTSSGLTTKQYMESDIYVTGNGNHLTYQEDTALNQVIPIILFGSDLNFSGNMIPNYPESIQTNINVYYPENGITNETPWLSYVTAPSGGSESGGEVDLTELITILQSIESKLGLLDSTSEDLTTLETAIAQFKFYTGGILKVHDEGIFDSLTDIGNDIASILAELQAWPKYDAPDAPDIIGDFDFPELQNKSDELLENIATLAPFGGLLLLSEMVGILSQTGNLSEPEFVVPFNFMPGHSYNVEIDLSWLEDAQVYINFFCILSLILCLLNVTVRIIELEAAS